MRQASAAAMVWAIIAAILVMWVPDRWATALPEICCFILAAVWAALFAFGAKPTWHMVLLPLAATVLLGVAQLGLRVTVYEFQTRSVLLYWAANLAITFVGLQCLDSELVGAWFRRCLLGFAFALSIFGPLQAFTSSGKIYWVWPVPMQDWYAFGPFLYTNQYAAFVELLLPIAIFEAVADGERGALWGLASATLYASVIGSASRAGFVITTVEMILVPGLLVFRHGLSIRIFAKRAALCLVVIALLAVAIGPEVLGSKLLARDPYAVRREYVVSSFAMIRDRPLTGVGLGNWAVAYPKYGLFDDGLYANQAHNDWAQFAVEGGIPFLVVMGGLFCIALRAAFRSTWGVGLAAIMIHSMVDYPLQRHGVALVFFALLSAALAERANAPPTP